MEVRLRGPDGNDEIVVPMHDGVTTHQAALVGRAASEYLSRNKTASSIRVALLDWIEHAIERSLRGIHALHDPGDEEGSLPRGPSFGASRAIGIGRKEDASPFLEAFRAPFDRAALQRARESLEEQNCVLVRKTGAIVERDTGRRRCRLPADAAEAFRLLRSWKGWEADVCEATFSRVLHAVTVPSDVNVPARAALRRCEAMCLLDCVECVASHEVSAWSLRRWPKKRRVCDSTTAAETLRLSRALSLAIAIGDRLPEDLVLLCAAFVVKFVDREVLARLCELR